MTYLRSAAARTTANAATIGCKRGTGFPSIDEGKLGRRLRCQRCSTRARTRKAIGLLCGATSRKVGSSHPAPPQRGDTLTT